jgi:hypothetical protein
MLRCFAISDLLRPFAASFRIHLPAIVAGLLRGFVFDDDFFEAGVRRAPRARVNRDVSNIRPTSRAPKAARFTTPTIHLCRCIAGTAQNKTSRS